MDVRLVEVTHYNCRISGNEGIEIFSKIRYVQMGGVRWNIHCTQSDGMWIIRAANVDSDHFQV